MEISAELYFYVTINGDCMEWKGGTDKKGYGVLNWKGKNARAHRLSYQLTYGDIPKGYLICHSCDNPKCINPKHLWAGTSKENSQDMMRKGRGNLKKGVRFELAPFRPHSKLNEENVIDIKKRLRNKETAVSISKSYGVSDRTIGAIKRGRLWSTIKLKDL